MYTQTLLALTFTALAVASPVARRNYKPECSEKYYDKTYEDCGHTFEYTKEKYCPGYASTKNGDCITKLSLVFDQCVKAVDHHRGYCWDPKYFKRGDGYDEPTYKKKYFYAANHSSKDGYEYDSGYRVCKHEVKNPSYDDKGRAYGWEDHKSCIIKADKKSYDNYDDSEYTPEYVDDYGTETQYEEPAYEEPAYEDEVEYEEPAHEEKEANYDYSQAYDTYPSQQKKSFSAYKFEEKHHQQYEKEYENYEKPKDNECKSATDYFKSTKSATLIQCAAIACAPGQTSAYRQRALYQCYALEKQAKATNKGHLPKNW